MSIYKTYASMPSLRHPGNAALPAGSIYLGGKDIRSSSSWGRLPERDPSRTAHAVHTAKPWNAEITERGWEPREAPVHPHQQLPTAGIKAPGQNDNTYTPSPAAVAWGKTRALSKTERQPKVPAQVTDLSVGTRPHRMPGYDTLRPMASVREPYAPSPALFAKPSPFRFETGFVDRPRAE